MSNYRAEFAEGARSSLPVVLAMLPFGALFGALAVNNGLSVFETVLFSMMVFAGASQMVGIELFGQHVAPWLIVLSIFAVNFRHVLYSAAIGRRIRQWTFLQKAVGFFFLTDPQFAEAERRGEAGKPISIWWYFGMVVPIYGFFIILCWLGALFGKLITNPEALGLDFMLPIYFLALVMAFRKRPLWLPVVAVSAVASVVAYEMVGSPWHVSLGAIAGVAAAVIASGSVSEKSNV
ncbi:MAG: AzlC family ABC transporter permease [Rhizobiaceae bacterium]